jgi:hypothetical protein
MLEEISITTCKLIFPFGSITSKEQVATILSKHTKDWSIANFYPEMEVGCNKMTFAVVDVPEKIIPDLMKEHAIKDIDMMFTAHRRSIKMECCEKGGCGCP